MTKEYLEPQPAPEYRILHSLTLRPIKQKGQVVINKDFGVRIRRSKSAAASISITCANGTNITLPKKPEVTIKPTSKGKDHTFFPLQLAKGETAQIGEYKLRASTSEAGVILSIEAHKPIHTIAVGRDEDLRDVLANLSSEDNLAPQ